MGKLVVRALNNRGLKKFREYIKKTRLNEVKSRKALPYPKTILNDSKYLTRDTYNVEIDPDEKFSCRYELGRYIFSLFETAGQKAQYGNAGLWAWLALAYYPELQNTKERSKTSPITQGPDHFVPAEWEKPDGDKGSEYRHSVRSFFFLVEKFGEDAKFFASRQGVSSFGDVAEQMLSDRKIMSSPKLTDLIFGLYKDSDGYAKVGTTARRDTTAAAKVKKSLIGYGKLRRLTDDYLPRMHLTYDIGDMDAQAIIAVAGKEFEPK
jgi:hypothetical protein